MTITRGQMRRELYGVGSLVGREKFGLGSKFKRFVRKVIPNEVADIAVKAAPFVAPFNPLLAGGMSALGTFDQTGSIGRSVKSGLMNYGLGQGARYLGGAELQKGLNLQLGQGQGLGSYFSSPIGAPTPMQTPSTVPSEGSYLPFQGEEMRIPSYAEQLAETSIKQTNPFKQSVQKVLSGDFTTMGEGLKELGGQGLKAIYTQPVPGSPGQTQIDKLAIGATIAGVVSYAEARKLAKEAELVDDEDEYTEEMYEEDRQRYKDYYSQILKPEYFGLKDGGRVPFRGGGSYQGRGGYGASRSSRSGPSRGPAGGASAGGNYGGNRNPNQTYGGGGGNQNKTTKSPPKPNLVSNQTNKGILKNIAGFGFNRFLNSMGVPTKDIAKALAIKDLIKGVGNVAFPEGNLQEIKTAAPNQKVYNIEATKDMVENLPGGTIKDIIAPVGALVTSPFYDAGQAFTRMEPGSGITGFAKALDAENPLSSAYERFVGASAPLAGKVSNFLNLKKGGRVNYAEGGLSKNRIAQLMSLLESGEIDEDYKKQIKEEIDQLMGKYKSGGRVKFLKGGDTAYNAMVTEMYIKAGGQEGTGMDIDTFAEKYFSKFAKGGRAELNIGGVPSITLKEKEEIVEPDVSMMMDTTTSNPIPENAAELAAAEIAKVIMGTRGIPGEETEGVMSSTEFIFNEYVMPKRKQLMENYGLTLDEADDLIRNAMNKYKKADGGRIELKFGSEPEEEDIGIMSLEVDVKDDDEDMLMAGGPITFSSQEKSYLFRKLAGAGGSDRSYTMPQLYGILKNPNSPANIDDAKVLKQIAIVGLGGVSKKDGGRIPYAMGSEVPVRQNQGGVTELDYRNTGGFVPIGVKEKADDVPAMLSKNEFVFTADAVRNAGGGDVNKGAKKMYNLMKSLENKVVV